MCDIVQNMCGMVPKMYSMLPKMCGMVHGARQCLEGSEQKDHSINESLN